MPSSPASQRRRRQRRQPVTRTSSLLGTIKSIVTAPFSWFGSADDTETPTGKRRRHPSPPPFITDRDGDDVNKSLFQPSKRIRKRSPSPSFPSSARPTGYLDPPQSAFRGSSSAPIRSASASFSHPSYPILCTPRTPSRTMSVDLLPRCAATRALPLSREVSMDRGSFVSSGSCDVPLPPSSSSNFFRLRTATPQPSSLREDSEPPPIISNPTFIRPPATPSRSPLSVRPSLTLGSLVDSTRSARSPIRQRNTFFAPILEHNSILPRPTNIVEKALQELEGHRPPLVPTRLRSPNGPISSTDLFKPRRSSQLVLMNENKRPSRFRKITNKQDARVTNDSKPYAGEGGLKKLLARRRLEEGEQTDERKLHYDAERRPADDSFPSLDRDASMSNGHPESSMDIEKSASEQGAPSPLSSFKSLPSLEGSSSSTECKSSSLRVGRNKTSRTHAHPVSRPKTSTFSVPLDEDDAMDEGGDVSARRKDQGILEGATKIPVFKAPEGFTFDKEIPPIKHDLKNAKEPPVTSLPFSLTKAPSPSGEQDVLQLSKEPNPINISSFVDLPLTKETLDKPSASVSVSAQSVPLLPPPTVTQPFPSLTQTTLNISGIPSIFSKSTFISQDTSVSETPLFVPPVGGQPPVTRAVFVSTGVGTDSPPSELLQATKNQTPTREGGKKEGDSAITEPATLLEADKSAVPVFSAGPQPLSTTELTPKNQNEVLATQTNTFISKCQSGDHADESSFQSSNKLNDKPSTQFALDTKSITNVLGSENGDQPVLQQPSAPAFSFGQPQSIFTNSVKFDDQASTVTVTPSPSKREDTSTFSFSHNGATSNSTMGLESSKMETSGDVIVSDESSKPTFEAGGTFGMNKIKTSEEVVTSPSFQFGGSKTPEAKPAGTPFLFSLTKPSETKSNSSPFSFNVSKPPEAQPASAPFTFAATTTVPESIGFTFSGGSDSSSAQVVKPFSSHDPTAVTGMGKQRHSTPPKNEEICMDESPSRDVQQTKVPERPSLSVGISNGFSFGNAQGGMGTSFGAQMDGASGSPFATNSFPSVGGIFGKKSNEIGKTFGGFGEQETGTPKPFSFVQKETVVESGGSSFSFGAVPATPTSVNTVGIFSFNNSTGSGFGQASSVPGSPSTFGPGSASQSQFQFNVPLAGVKRTFSFGSSQPSSPAGGSTNLPVTSSSSSGFGGGATMAGFGQGTAVVATSPFGAPLSPATGTTNGQPLFTIGAAPEASAPRQIKRMPTRRGVKR